MSLFLIVLLGLIFLAVGIVEVVLTEKEKYGWATLGLIGTVAVLQLFNVANVFAFVHDHLATSLELAACYFAGGVVWSFAKWYLFLVGFRGEVIRARERWFKSKALPLDTVLTATQVSELKDWLGKNDYSNYRYNSKYSPNMLNRVPQANDNKGRITAWIGLWPFSLLGWMLNDPLARLVNAFFLVFRSAYQRMSNYIFRDLKDME